ncbi:MAG: mannose-1-phosphate guanylyltransferase/mannose-6-phosphate isomerase [Parvularculaceae bacterium]
MRIQPVIMSGGAGTRLWPMSRKARPKQFLPLTSSKSLFQETALRVASDGLEPDFAAPIIIGGAAHAEMIAGQLQEIDLEARAIVTEPCPRNTAAVAAVAATLTEQLEPGVLVLLLPADHEIADAAAFRAAVRAGADAAAAGAIVTFGIRPSEPHTGYGYIERGRQISPSVYEIQKFYEKPELAKAETYFKSGAHYWNAGIFLYSAKGMIDEFRALEPEILAQATKALQTAKTVGVRCDLDAEAFAACPSNSIDYAIMEKTSKAAVVGPVDAGWNDVGSWSSLTTASADDRIYTIDAENCVIRTDGAFVGVVGLDDVIVVASGGAVLVAPKSRAQDVKKIVEELKARKRDDLL